MRLWIELLDDNITECRANMLEVFCRLSGLTEADELYRASLFCVVADPHGDATKMRDTAGAPISGGVGYSGNRRPSAGISG